MIDSKPRQREGEWGQMTAQAGDGSAMAWWLGMDPLDQQLRTWWLEHHTSPNIPWEDLTYFNGKKPSVGAALDSLASGFDCEAPSIGWRLRCGEGPDMMRRCAWGEILWLANFG